jgi:outer membrane biosynthesis protein TonB
MTSYATSGLIHGGIIVLLMLIYLPLDYSPSEYVELSFGISTKTGSSGAKGTQIEKVEEVSKPEIKSQTQEKNKEVKEVKLPQAKNTSDENVIKPADKNKEVSEKSTEKNDEENTSDVTTEGQGNKAEGEGSFGFDIDFGGQGTRKIYSFLLPEYPDGVKKEADIKLEFKILPDGTVGTIIPKIKADTRLENAAINSLRQWRFEPLSPYQKQSEQTAVIVFPYRLQ